MSAWDYVFQSLFRVIVISCLIWIIFGIEQIINAIEERANNDKRR